MLNVDLITTGGRMRFVAVAWWREHYPIREPIADRFEGQGLGFG